MKTQFEQDLQNQLRHSEQTIDTENLTQLADIRHQALGLLRTRKTSPPHHRWRCFSWPTAGMALASLLVIVLATPLSPFTSPSSIDYLSDNTELYDDLGFYYWLAENEQSFRG
ncbi:MAG: hypothetical protein COA75_03015 [Cellvibrionales bacterium]|nr:MAG: hypothetical protein COA75_03015 [Cellvibrionales bacterium]